MAMSTLHPVAYPFPPPRNNTMDPDHRARLLRTARKLQALLGTAPQVAEWNEDRAYRSTKARRRNGIYGAQFSSSVSSLDSTSSEKESHQHGFSWPGRDDPSSHGKVLVANDEKLIKKTKGGRQPLAQPLLLRMPAVPVDHRGRKASIAGKAAGPAVSSIHPRPFHATPAPPLLTPFERRKLKIDSVLGPLSPINKNHFPTQPSNSKACSDLDLPLSPLLSASNTQDAIPLTGLSDREKRIKMAKLQRMMGENIPPELVFKAAPAVEKAEKMPRRRSRSMSAIRTESVLRKGKGKGKEIAVRPLPALPTFRTPPRSLPPTPQHRAPIITQTTTTTTSGPLIRQTSQSMKQKSRKPRPRSLTLGSSSALVAANVRLARQEKEVLEAAVTARGTVSLDEDRHRKSDEKRSSDEDKTQVPIAKHADAPFIRVREEKIPNLATIKTELWRRKEREWSGEWNVQDMEEVARALRGLRAS